MVAPMEEVDEPKYFSNTVVMNSSRFKQFKSTSFLQNFHKVTKSLQKKSFSSLPNELILPLLHYSAFNKDAVLPFSHNIHHVQGRNTGEAQHKCP